MIFSVVAGGPTQRLAWPALALTVALISGCTSASLEDAASGARNTNTFPNLNVPMQAQTAQFSDAERAAGVASLQSARARAIGQGGASAAPSAAELQRLGTTHGPDALREIEAELEDE